MHLLLYPAGDLLLNTWEEVLGKMVNKSTVSPSGGSQP